MSQGEVDHIQKSQRLVRGNMIIAVAWQATVQEMCRL